MTVEEETGGYFTLTGALMAVLCVYVLFGRVLGLYVFDKSPNIRRRLMVQVVVLDQLGDSSRMCAHAVSLAESGCTVDLIGYNGKPPGARVTTNRHIRIRPIRKIGSPSPLWLQLLWTPYKAILLGLQLFWVMACVSQKPDFIIVQNRPSLPTLVLGKLVGILRKSWFIIDWHDAGPSQLVQKLGQDHPVVKLAHWYEKKFGTIAYAHLAANQSIYRELNERGVQGKLITVRDLPSSDYKRLGIERAHHVWTYSSLRNIEHGYKDGTLVTKVKDEVLSWREERPKIIVAPWPKDDKDILVLFGAFDLYEASAYPKDSQLMVVLTGAPKEHEYLRKIEKMDLKKVRVVTADIELGDYPSLLGSADLGISLNRKGSPTTIVDMFGCATPVCTVPFPSLDEFVRDNENGLVFETSQDLVEQWTELFSKNPKKLDDLQRNIVKEYANNTWQSQYKEVLYFLFDQNN